MDKKSMGSFIAALRKARGWTQKDLAELLHVSDKTVSRWETGDGAPDLALVPVLAELFGVSCDELLRGERKPETDAVETTPLGEKRKKWMFDRIRSRFLAFNIVAAAISVVGVLLMNFFDAVTNREYLLATACCVVSIAVQAVGLVRAYASMGELGEDTYPLKKQLRYYTELFALAPLIGLVLSAAEKFGYGSSLALFFVPIWAVVCLAINRAKKGKR